MFEIYDRQSRSSFGGFDSQASAEAWIGRQIDPTARGLLVIGVDDGEYRVVRDYRTETEIPLSDVPDDPSEGMLPEDAPLTDDPEPGQAGGETDPEAETQSGEPA